MTPDELISRTNALMERHEHWWREPEAQAELKALWGGEVNDCGVFHNAEEEVLFDRDGYRAVVSVGHAGGVFAFGCGFSYSTGGFGHAPSLTGDLYPTRDAARTAGIEYLNEWMPKQLFPHEHAHRAKFDRVRQALARLLAQPSLF